MNRVRVAVRQIALDGKPFTAFDIQRRTGLNIESIRTEIQRLRKGGFLDTSTSKTQPAERGPGAPAALYSLTPDPARIQELRGTVASFYLSVPVARTSRPTSEHFISARHALNDATKAMNSEERENLLATAELELQAAWLSEGDGGATEELKAHLLFESARLKLLHEDYSDAEMQFAHCRDVFVEHGDYDHALLADDNVLACEIKKLTEREKLCLATLNTLRGRTASPLALAVLEAAQSLESAEEVRLDDYYVGNDISRQEFRHYFGELEVCTAALS